MFDYETTLASIEGKIKQLGTESDVRGASADIDEERIALEELINEQNILINTLKEENNSLKQGIKLTQQESTADIKSRINQLIDIIDNSLATLEQTE
ncbi:MAG: hypothetical protein K6F85_03200 [Bacteroidales bacterium]|nr:hypothetical protein [Bacteroidales bacterium]